jgi:hypothetical protein
VPISSHIAVHHSATVHHVVSHQVASQQLSRQQLQRSILWSLQDRKIIVLADNILMAIGLATSTATV